MSVAAIILAAGRGERAKTKSKAKQYYKINNKTILEYSLEPFLENEKINPIFVVVHKDDEVFCKEILKNTKKKIYFAIGGKTRQESVLNGLKALQKFKPTFVHIHDAARPFVTKENLEKLYLETNISQASLLASPISDTLKEIGQSYFVQNTKDRKNFFCAQTPQCFSFSKILKFHEKASSEKKEFTDDSSLAEYYGYPVKIIENTSENFKITFPEDIARAKNMIMKKNNFLYPDVRLGNGYDIHSFVPLSKNDFITLCGVDIPYHKNLNGHSDSDVAFHALTDALLGVLGEGDIGTFFPPSDFKWKNADSAIFLKFAYQKIKEKDAKIANIDITLIAQEPKIGPYRQKMISKLSTLLNLSKERISIKATTNEELGALGRCEGIAAFATASVIFPHFL